MSFIVYEMKPHDLQFWDDIISASKNQQQQTDWGQKQLELMNAATTNIGKPIHFSMDVANGESATIIWDTRNFTILGEPLP